MAFVENNVSDPTQVNPTPTANPAAGLNPAINQAPQTATATSSQSSAGSGGQGAAATPTSSTAAPVQNLNAYLTANAPQAQQLGQNIAQGLTSQYGQIQGDVNNASTKFNQGVQSATTPFNSQLLSSAQSDPSKFASDPNNVSQFQSQISGKYAGPTDFSQQQGYGDLNSEIQNAVSNAGNANSQAGLTSLVNSQEHNPTPGQSTLDAMILGGNPDAWSSVRQAAAPFSSLGQFLTDTKNTDNAGALAAQQTNQATGQSVQQGLNSTANDFTTALNQKVQDAAAGLKNYGSEINNYTGQIQKGGLNGLSAFDQNVLGIDPAIGGFARGGPGIESAMSSGWNNLPSLSMPNLQDAFTMPTVSANGTPTLQNVASADDYAKAQALEQLAGNNLGLPLDASTASQAGSFKVPTALPTFDAKKGAQEIYNAFQPWASPGGVTPVPNGNAVDPTGAATSAETQYVNYMNSLAQYLGQPAFNSNFPTTSVPTGPVTPVGTGPGGGPPFLGPIGGDVHNGRA